MNWKLINVTQETNHPYLNFFTLHYEVNGKKYDYFMASRHNKEEIYALHRPEKPDGVMMACYHIDEKQNVSILVTTQFRPALNRHVTSFPAGLVEPNDDIFTCAKREAIEEGGVIIDNLELLCPASPTSSGLSDEINSVVLGQIVGFKDNKLEEFEDISVKLIPLKEILKMLDDPQYFFALNVRLLIKYLALRFKNEK